ncbi:hypothetical protein Tco_0020577 [Tanacetum coccineum]
MNQNQIGRTVFDIDEEIDALYLQKATEYHEWLLQQEAQPRLTRTSIFRDREDAERRLRADYFDDHSLEDELTVMGYTYDIFQTNRDDTKSQSGYMFIMNGGVVAWRSSKQYTISMSFAESEYNILLEAAKVAYWMKKFIEELGVLQSIENHVKVYCNNSSTILLASECITQRGIHIDENTVDPLTKALPCEKNEFHVNGMVLRYVGLESS